MYLYLNDNRLPFTSFACCVISLDIVLLRFNREIPTCTSEQLFVAHCVDFPDFATCRKWDSGNTRRNVKPQVQRRACGKNARGCRTVKREQEYLRRASSGRYRRSSRLTSLNRINLSTLLPAIS